MQKNLMRVGNSCGLVIERPILDLLGWFVGMAVDVDIVPTADGKGLTITPIAVDDSVSDHKARVRQASQNVIKRHREAFKKLAE